MRDRSVNLLLVFGSTAFCLLIFEIALRIVGFNPFEGLLNGRELILRKAENQTMVYELTPNSHGVAWGAPVSINSNGFRDRDFNLVKPDGIYRIGVIGDSITFGNHLNLEETYAKRLEQFFHQHNMPVEVLNFGVGGYDGVQAVAFLEQIALRFDLDEVIVGYCMNDAGTVSSNLRYIQRAATYNSPIYRIRTIQFIQQTTDRIFFKIRSLSSTFTETPEPAHFSEIELQAEIRERMQWIEEYTSNSDSGHPTLAWYADSRKVRKVAGVFDQLRTLSAEHRFDVSVLIIPYLNDHIEAHDWAYDIVRREAERNGFDVIEVLDRFLETGMSDLQLKSRDVIHPNPMGHSIIGETLFEYYRSHATQGPFLGREPVRLQE